MFIMILQLVCRQLLAQEHVPGVLSMNTESTLHLCWTGTRCSVAVTEELLLESTERVAWRRLAYRLILRWEFSWAVVALKRANGLCLRD